MTTKSLFKYGTPSEQNLYESNFIEMVQMYGQDVYYIPRTSLGEDKILADDILNSYKDAFVIEMYIENVNGFEGEGDLFTKFGIEIRDAVVFILSEKRWMEEIASKQEENWYRPREGDLIYLPMSKSLFEITKADHKFDFYQVGFNFMFKLSCELYEYSGEHMDTGIADIDRVEDFAYQLKLVMSDSCPAYTVGELVTQTFSSGVSMRGEVVKVDYENTPTLYIAHAGADDGKLHNFTTGIPVIGQTSGSSWSPTLVEELQYIQRTEQGEDYQESALGILDWSESNPFGDP
jgi:Virus neck protein